MMREGCREMCFPNVPLGPKGTSKNPVSNALFEYSTFYCPKSSKSMCTCIYIKHPLSQSVGVKDRNPHLTNA